MFRRVGLSDMRTILTALSRDPMMIDWLDNQENHRTERNENYGRELLELFSMGVGNYSEDDIKSAASAFSGWSFTQPIPGYPYGQHHASFVYREEDHDDGVKSFLGEEGRFNGEDIIDIVVRQPATARFVARHLYNFFVADEAQVPAWNETGPPRSGGHRRPDERLRGDGRGDTLHSEGALQLRLLQGGAVDAGEVPRRVHSRHESSWPEPTGSRSRAWMPCPARPG